MEIGNDGYSLCERKRVDSTICGHYFATILSISPFDYWYFVLDWQWVVFFVHPSSWWSRFFETKLFIQFSLLLLPWILINSILLNVFQRKYIFYVIPKKKRKKIVLCKRHLQEFRFFSVIFLLFHNRIACVRVLSRGAENRLSVH